MKLNGLSRPHIPIGILLLLGTLAGSSVDENYDETAKNPAESSSNLAAANNGALKLIVQAYVDSILRNIQNDVATGIVLNGPAVDVVRTRMKALPRHLENHPALVEKRLWVGANQPNFDPFLLNNIETIANQKKVTVRNAKGNQLRPASGPSKRNGVSRNSYLAEEICGTDRQWELINRTTDFDAHEVEIIHTEEFRQYIFVYRCVAQRGPCLGISPLYNSECEMRYGWVNMYHRRLDIPDSASQWGFVAVPHHCACKITPKFIGRD